jgi:hypothetical protein
MRASVESKEQEVGCTRGSSRPASEVGWPAKKTLPASGITQWTYYRWLREDA